MQVKNGEREIHKPRIRERGNEKTNNKAGKKMMEG